MGAVETRSGANADRANAYKSSVICDSAVVSIPVSRSTFTAPVQALFTRLDIQREYVEKLC